MRNRFIATGIIVLLLLGTLFYGASGKSYWRSASSAGDAVAEAPQTTSSGNRRMVDMVADDSYLIERGDSTIFILVGNFAAHHNGAVILADSAVRYSNQSFECFGNVLINQNSTYAYGERAEYNRNNSTATIYSELIKVVDGEAIMYTYNCTFDTANEVGHFYGGCYVEKGESLMESDRGYYYTDSHELIAVDNVEMRDATYQMVGDSVIFNTETEDARYFTNTNIWNDKDEYLFANEGYYIKATDTHNLTRDAYILSPEREIWSDSIEYCRANGHIIGRGNIQMDDTTQKVLGFADYGEWWDDPGNALFTRRPSMINYDPSQPDSLFLAADTLWLYTISAVPAPAVEADSTAVGDVAMDEQLGAIPDAEEDITAEEPSEELAEDASGDAVAEDVEEDVVAEDAEDDATVADMPTDAPLDMPADASVAERGERGEQPSGRERSERTTRGEGAEAMPSPRTEADSATMQTPIDGDRVAEDSVACDTVAEDSVAHSTLVYSTKEAKRLTRDSIRTAERAVRDSLRAMRLAERDSVRAIIRAERDSLRAIRRAVRDSIRYVRDSLLDIKIDTIIARRIAHNARLADEEAARIERIRQKAEERHRRKIDKAKARAARRGREYTGEDYVVDSVATDSTSLDSLMTEREGVDSLAGRDMQDSLLRDSMALDSLACDSLLSAEPEIPADSVYKMIKAYRNVRMYRSDTQMVCDSMLVLNTDSVIRLYIEPIMWNESNQITADSMAIYTRNQLMERAHFMGDPIMGAEIDTTYYNQVKGKDMMSYFRDGQVYRNDVNTNAQTIYYMQEEEGDMAVTGLMYIESASMSFYLTDGEMDQIVYRQNPEYIIYPLAMIPETQQLRLDGFEWHRERRPSRDSVCDRAIRPTRRAHSSTMARPRFRITERINYDRRRLTENRVWVDRLDVLSPDVVEWRNSRPSYQNR